MGANAGNVLTFTSTGEVGGIWGSSGAATRKFHGITDDSEFVLEEKIEEVPAVGWYGPSPVSEEVSQYGSGTLKGIACYEELPTLFGGLFSHTSGSSGNSTGGTTAPYVYNWQAQVSSTQVCTTFGIEYGSTSDTYAAYGSILTGVKISGEAESLWKFESPFVSKFLKPLTAASTAAWVDRTVNPVAMADTKIYIDAFSSGTIGATVLPASLISFELDADLKRHIKFFGGSKNPQGWGDAKAEGTLSVVVEYGSTVKSYIDSIMGTSSGTKFQRQVRIQALNSTNTASTDRRSATIDFAGIQDGSIQLWSDRDGNETVEFKLKGKYSTGLSNWLKLQIENGSSSTT
jgi:hypothetical protein